MDSVSGTCDGDTLYSPPWKEFFRGDSFLPVVFDALAETEMDLLFPVHADTVLASRCYETSL